ncbi:MAG: complex I subunit 1 family protein [Microthrixaceae bacterium]
MIGVDPLLNAPGGTAWLIILIKVVGAFAGLMVAVMGAIWFERKLHADFSNRLGPRVAGPFGMFQSLADGVKLFFKTDLLPENADPFVFRLAPYLSLIPAFMVFMIVPIGGDFSHGGSGTVKVFGHDTLMQVIDPQIGILFVLALSSIAVYGIMLAGWSSGSKYPLLGSVRATAQMISYEAALGLSLLCVLLNSGSLSTNAIVRSQATWQWNLWATGLVPFVVFVIAATAEMNRPPFDLVEAEQELVGGFNTEYSSIRFALFYLAEFMNVITMSAVITTLFLGGPVGPTFGLDGWAADYVLPFVWFFVKVFALIVMFVLFRTTLPRLRYDQLMDLGWKLLIPLTLAWFLMLTAFKVGDKQGWNPLSTALGALAVIGVGAVALVSAIRVARARRLAGEVNA